MAKILVSLLLFGYFGFIIIPEWFIFLSPQFIFWIFALPVVIITLVVIGIRSGLGLWREKTQNIPSSPENKFSVWFAGLGILWFLVSIAIANSTHYAYNHKEFDSELWKTGDWEGGGLFELSSRERVLDDLTENVLPGRTKMELLNLLGEPDEKRNVAGDETIYYYTGQGIMDPQCLFIIFDEQNYIKENGITVCE